MRNFEEIKAEIFRRSEKRIKKRKIKRNKILALCIPLCFVVSVCAVIGFSPKTSVERADKNEGITSFDINALAESNINSDKSDTQANQNTIMVEITDINNAEFYTKITEPLAVEKAYEKISLGFNNYIYDAADDSVDDFITDKNSVPTDNESDKSDSLKGDTTYEKPIYAIKMILSDGVEKLYTLKGNVLCDEARDIEMKLEAEQLEELKSVLGIVN